MVKVPASGGRPAPPPTPPSRRRPDTGPKVAAGSRPAAGAKVTAAGKSAAKEGYYKAGAAANKAASAAISSATGGVGGAAFNMLPKPTDRPEDRARKKKRLIIIAAIGAFGALLSFMMPFIVGMTLITLIGGAAGGAMGGTPADGNCQSFAAPRVTQGAAAGQLGAPLDPQYMQITSPFGYREVGVGTNNHDGTDIAAPGIYGAPIYAVGAGTVTEAGPAQGYGNWVIIRHTLPGGQIVDSLYGHMEDGHVLVKPGQQVTAGQHIADVGNAGWSSGAHLHLGMYPGGWSSGAGVDPMPWLDKFKAAGGPPAPSSTSPTSPPSPTGPEASSPQLEGISPYPPGGTQKDESLTAEQQANVRAILAAAKESELTPPARAAVLAGAYSGQRTNFISKAKSGDGAGVGIFNQTPLGQMEIDNLATNPKFAASEFFKTLKQVANRDPAWATKPVGDVLVAMFPEQVTLRDEFAGWEQLAINAVTGMWDDAYSKAGAPVQQVSLAGAEGCDQGVTGGGISNEALADGTVPERYRKWIQLAGSLCAGIAPPVLASQLHAENQFRDGDSAPVSETGAQGPAQFMPGTWATWGQPVDDAGRPTGPPGTGDVNAVPDAVMAQGRFMCALNAQVKDGLRSGRIRGDELELTIAAYNAGYGAVENAGGMPSGGDYTTQTQPYVRKIVDNAKRFAAPPSAPSSAATEGTVGARIVAVARQQIGLPYIWGGGNVDGKTGSMGSGSDPKGFDCSGLAMHAVYAGTGRKVVLPRTSEQQSTLGTAVSVSDARPGDLVFSMFNGAGRTSPGHVAVYAGNGLVIEAATEGIPIREHPLPADAVIRRVADVNARD